MMQDDEQEPVPQALQQLAQDLDAPGPALSIGPERADALIARALHEAKQTPAPSAGPGRKLRSRRTLVVAALVLLASSAAAALYQSVLRSSEPPPAPTPAAGAAVAKHEGTSPPPAPPARPEPESAAVDDEPPPVAEEPPTTTAPAPAAAVKPEDLLSKANQLRREGRLGEAETAYTQLIRREPHSASGYVARVALAELKLGKAPRDAIDLFLAAQRQSPKGALDIEIRKGLAMALRSVGDRSAERRQLGQLLALYPKSVAAEWARTRLQELQ